MAGPVTSSGGGVSMVFEPPIEFILRQSGAFRRDLEDLEPLWEMFKPIMAEFEEEQFATEGHGEWPPLAESTMRYRDSQPILQQTNTLRQSLIDPAQAAQTGPMQMVWQTDVPYAIYHQEGTEKMPAREVIPDPFPVDARRRFEVAMVTWINEVAARTFGRI